MSANYPDKVNDNVNDHDYVNCCSSLLISNLNLSHSVGFQCSNAFYRQVLPAKG